MRESKGPACVGAVPVRVLGKHHGHPYCNFIYLCLNFVLHKGIEVSAFGTEDPGRSRSSDWLMWSSSSQMKSKGARPNYLASLCHLGGRGVESLTLCLAFTLQNQ